MSHSAHEALGQDFNIIRISCDTSVKKIHQYSRFKKKKLHCFTQEVSGARLFNAFINFSPEKGNEPQVAIRGRWETAVTDTGNRG